MSFSHFNRSAADWIALIRRRDPLALSDLHRLCLYVSTRCLREWNEADSQDAAMDALIKIILDVDRPDFTIRSSFEGYVYRTTNRHCFDIKRRIYLERELSVDTSIDTLAAPDAETAAEAERRAARRAPLHRALRACIEQLGSDDQQIIGWSGAGEGPSVIAQRLGPPATANNIGVRLHRIRRALKRCMELSGPTPGRAV